MALQSQHVIRKMGLTLFRYSFFKLILICEQTKRTMQSLLMPLTAADNIRPKGASLHAEASIWFENGRGRVSGFDN